MFYTNNTYLKSIYSTVGLLDRHPHVINSYSRFVISMSIYLNIAHEIQTEINKILPICKYLPKAFMNFAIES